MDVKIITDRHTKRSKGLAYVEFAKAEQVFMALALNGQPLKGQPVMVKPAEAEKNLAWEAAQAAKQQQASAAGGGGGSGGLTDAAGAPLLDPALAAVPMKLQVMGFTPAIGEAELRQLFEPFAQSGLDGVTMVRDAAGQAVGIAYVVFKNGLEAQVATQHWNGRGLLDFTLSVTAAPLSAAEGGPVTTVGELDEDEDNFKLSGSARAALMNRLAGSAGLVPAAAPAPAALPAPAAFPGVDPNVVLEQGKLGPPSPIPTPCLLLKNMFDPAQTAADPNLLQELTEDVTEEGGRFGELQHIWVDPDSRVRVARGGSGLLGGAASSETTPVVCSYSICTVMQRHRTHLQVPAQPVLQGLFCMSTTSIRPVLCVCVRTAMQQVWSAQLSACCDVPGCATTHLAALAGGRAATGVLCACPSCSQQHLAAPLPFPLPCTCCGQPWTLPTCSCMCFCTFVCAPLVALLPCTPSPPLQTHHQFAYSPGCCSRCCCACPPCSPPVLQGFVYLKFSNPEGAQAAHRVLHGRFYMGRQILAEYQFLQPYNQHFQLQ
jgi:RNA-binding protein 39